MYYLQLSYKQLCQFDFSGMLLGGFGRVLGTFLEDFRAGLWDMFGAFFLDLRVPYQKQ